MTGMTDVEGLLGTAGGLARLGGAGDALSWP